MILAKLERIQEIMGKKENSKNKGEKIVQNVYLFSGNFGK